MASTYGNDLRLEEIGDGEQSGTWGATTNTNLELIAEALSFGTEAITTNADTHTTTIADGATDPGRSLYLKYTGTLDSTCTITIAPNSISKTWYIENGTTGSQSIIISQGSGANVTIPTGQTKVVYSDGAGSGAAMAEIGTLGVTNLNVSGDITVGDDLTVTDDMTVGGTLGVTGVLTGTSLDISGNVDIDGTLETDALSINSTAVTSTAAELNILDGVTATTAELNIMDGVTATTAELNIMDGVTSTTAELNILDGVTSTTTEINQLDAITRGSILYGNASGATARLAKGGAATVLTSDGTDISWAAAAEGGTFLPYPKYPSDWGSPSSNYTSSGTWSKGGLDGSTTVWIYLVSGGQGGNSGVYSLSGNGGRAVLLCGWADLFDGGTYVVGAGGTGLQGGPNFQSGNIGGASSFTLSSSNGGSVFTTGAIENAQTNADFWSGNNVIYCGGAQSDLTNDLMSNVGAYTFVEGDLPTVGGQLYNRWQSQGALTTIAAQYIVFGGGSGGTGYGNGAGVPSISLYAGNGGVRGANGNGVAPGGGGGGSNSSSDTAGNGAAGSVRVYHVS